VFVDEIRSRIDTYFRIVVRNVRDTVPKIVGYFLVRAVMDTLQRELYESINRSESILNCLSEPAHITTERENIKKQLATLRKAEKILKHDPNLASQAEGIEDEIAQQELELKRLEEDNKRKKALEDNKVDGDRESPVQKQPDRNAGVFAQPKKGLF